MKYIICIIDGASDYKLKQLGGKTPLQVAKKPNIDFLASKGCCGLFKTIPENFYTGSAVANLSILGYDPKKYFHGRGVLEAAAMGVKLEEEDVAFRCNLINVKNGKIKSHSAGHITTQEAKILIETINKELGNREINFYPGVSYRNLLVLRKNYSPEVECFPPHDYIEEDFEKLLPRGKTKSGEKTAELLRQLILKSKEILENHPVNMEREKNGKMKANLIWPWSGGKKPQMETFTERFNIKGAVISAVDLIKGLGVYCGFDIINVKGATGLYDTNYEGKAESCVKGLEKYDLIYLHVEGPDEASHEGNVNLKIRCIEDFDRRLLGNILKKIDINKTSIAILPDHPTPVEKRIHTTEPVPFLIYKPGIEPDKVMSFDEESCKLGKYGILTWKEFIYEFLK